MVDTLDGVKHNMEELGMKKKRTIIGITVVIVVLLMVSSVAAVTTPKINERKVLEKMIDSQTNKVNPNINLSGLEKMQILIDSLNLVSDPDFRMLIQEMIILMDLKGYVDSNDIEQIISNNDLVVGTVTFGRIDTGNNCGGGATCLRRPFCLWVVLPVAVLRWSAFFQKIGTINPYYVDITIDGQHITYKHNGIAIGFIGLVMNGIPLGVTIHGFALLIIYKASTGQEQQIIPSLQSDMLINQRGSTSLFKVIIVERNQLLERIIKMST